MKNRGLKADQVTVLLIFNPGRRRSRRRRCAGQGSGCDILKRESSSGARGNRIPSVFRTKIPMIAGSQFTQDASILPVIGVSGRGYLNRRPDQAFAAVHFSYGGIKTPFSRTSFQINVTRHGHSRQNPQDNQDCDDFHQGETLIIA